MSPEPRVARFAWLTLAFTVAVILWGAYVRATGSGAGCGSHWPLCNGQVIPRAAAVETAVEFTHRATSGIALLLVVALAVVGFRRYRRGHPVRAAVAAALVLMLVEAGIGAALVLFELVAENESMARALAMPIHLANTFLLLAALALAAFWASGGGRPVWRRRDRQQWALVAGLVGLLVVGASGAVTALGDTLHPDTTLTEAMAQDLPAVTHLLLRLRVLHPLAAAGVGLLLLLVAPWAAGGAWPGERGGSPRRAPAASPAAAAATGGQPARLAAAVVLTVLVQLAVGAASYLLGAPVWLQLVHLALADLLWILIVLLLAAHLARAGRRVADRTAEPEVRAAGAAA